MPFQNPIDHPKSFRITLLEGGNHLLHEWLFQVNKFISTSLRPATLCAKWYLKLKIRKFHNFRWSQCISIALSFISMLPRHDMKVQFFKVMMKFYEVNFFLHWDYFKSQNNVNLKNHSEAHIIILEASIEYE